MAKKRVAQTRRRSGGATTSSGRSSARSAPAGDRGTSQTGSAPEPSRRGAAPRGEPARAAAKKAASEQPSEASPQSAAPAAGPQPAAGPKDDATRLRLAREAERLQNDRIKRQSAELKLRQARRELLPRRAWETFAATLLIELSRWADELPELLASACTKRDASRVRTRLKQELDRRRNDLRAELERRAREIDEETPAED